MAEHLREIIVPVEQDTVNLFGCPVIAVRLPDGRIAAVFTHLCNALGLDRASQARRVRTDEVIGDQMPLAEVEIDGTRQPSDVLTAWAVPIWLTGIRLGMLAAEKRPAILAFKREAADVLYKHFAYPHTRHEAMQPSVSTSLVPSEPIEMPGSPGAGATMEEWRSWRAQMRAWLDWQDDMATWRGETSALLAEHDRQIGELHSRVEGQEEVSRMLADALGRLDPPTLSPAHQSTVQKSVNYLHDLAGFPHAAIYNDLRQDFHVGSYKQIADGQWPEVMGWFKARIDAAQKRQPRGR